MTKAVFTASETSAYEDLKEKWYHFPNTYLSQVREALDDLVIFYEPRRSNGLDRSGSQSYYATARVVAIRKDPNRVDHHFADLADYVEFDQKIPFKTNDVYFETALQKPDGSTNKGAFGRSVRLIPDSQFSAIISAGLSSSIEEARAERNDNDLAILLPPPAVIERRTTSVTITRKIRDIAFRRHVRIAYGNTCAMTGLRLHDARGYPEVQAAHIRPVKYDGSDSIRNGIALTSTVHWLFDQGLISVSDDFRILRATEYIGALEAICLRDVMTIPNSYSNRPHPTHLQWHRENVFLDR